MMLVDLCWFDEDETVLHFVFHDPWSVVEFSAVNEVAVEWLKKRPLTVDAIFDLSNAQSLPSVLNSAFQWSKGGSLNMLHPAQTVVVCDQRFSDIMTDVAHKLLGGAAVRAASTLEDAVDLLSV